MVWRTSRFATFMRPRPRFPWKFNRPFYISRHLINWPCVTIWWGYFSRVHERKFLWSIQVCACRGDWNFSPRVERASSLCVRRFLQGISTSLFDFDTKNDTFEGTLWSDDSSTSSVENRHFRFNQSLYTKKKKMNYISKKKTSNSINDLWPRNLNRAISARFRFRYHLERF